MFRNKYKTHFVLMQSFLKHEINFILFAAARVEKGKLWPLKEPCPDPTMTAGRQRDSCPNIPWQQFPYQESQRHSKQSSPGLQHLVVVRYSDLPASPCPGKVLQLLISYLAKRRAWSSSTGQPRALPAP